ncbi:hypothetical protein FOCC_FOCC001066 [Frankliniella occidentalis]|nr:hypothetical protein FOCC_FOCC001066 [Frankliniella occidentalis]
MTEDVTLVVCFTLDLVLEAARSRLGEDSATTPVGVPGVEVIPEGVSITSIPMRSSKSTELEEKDCLMICFLLLLNDCCTLVEDDDDVDEVVDDLDDTCLVVLDLLERDMASQKLLLKLSKLLECELDTEDCDCRLDVAGAAVAAVVVAQVDGLGRLECAGLLHVVDVAEAEPTLAVIEGALVYVHLLLESLAARLRLALPTQLLFLAGCLLLLLLLVAADHRRQIFHVALVQEVERVLQVVHGGAGRGGLGAGAADDAVLLHDDHDDDKVDHDHQHDHDLRHREEKASLRDDPRGRRLLVCTGGLRRLQEIPAEPGSAIAESVAVINCCFPEEIVRYYSPGFPDSLLDLMEETVDVQPLDLDQEHVSRWSPPSDGPRGQGARADGLCGADADYRDQKEKALPNEVHK